MTRLLTIGNNENRQKLFKQLLWNWHNFNWSVIRTFLTMYSLKTCRGSKILFSKIYAGASLQERHLLRYSDVHIIKTFCLKYQSYRLTFFSKISRWKLHRKRNFRPSTSHERRLPDSWVLLANLRSEIVQQFPPPPGVLAEKKNHGENTSQTTAALTVFTHRDVKPRNGSFHRDLIAANTYSAKNCVPPCVLVRGLFHRLIVERPWQSSDLFLPSRNPLDQEKRG